MLFRSLAAIPLHGLDAIVVVAAAAIEAGPVSGEHMLNLLARLTQPPIPLPYIPAPLTLIEEPRADVARYDQLLQPEITHEH